MKSRLCCILSVGLFGIFFCLQAAWAKPELRKLNLTPEAVHINAFFSGETLTLTGQIPATEDVIIEITGKDTEDSFDLTGRIGPFWMTKGSVEIDNVPVLYLLLTPEGPDWDQTLSGLDLGMTHLETRAKATGTVEVPSGIFGMFTALKEKEGLYRTVGGAVSYTGEADGIRDFTAKCRLPALIGSGTYRVQAFTVKDHAVTGRMETSFRVDEVGFVKLVDRLASDRRIAYGVSAVVIALFAGLVMGILFKQDGGSH